MVFHIATLYDIYLPGGRGQAKSFNAAATVGVLLMRRHMQCSVNGLYGTVHHRTLRHIGTAKGIAIPYIHGPYPGIAPGGYSMHYTNTNPNPYPGAIPG